jgi:hypothetical protein
MVQYEPVNSDQLVDAHVALNHEEF